jgi:hypothetical protein
MIAHRQRFDDVQFQDSDLYNADYSHVLRNRGKKKVSAQAMG